MALNCQMLISTPTYAAGQTPVPVLAMLVVNPNAVAVSVTGVEFVFKDQLGNVVRPALNTPMFPIGPGQGTSIAASSSQTFGPMAIAVYSAANSNTAQMVPPGSQPANIQAAERSQTEVYIGANVYASDGSVNQCGAVKLLVSYMPGPPPLFQGGSAQFNGANNAVLSVAVL